jgi:ADP-heptose:LPS heptosyltransferase
MFLSTATARVRVATLLGIDTLLKLTRSRRLHPNRVLVVRLDAIGDFILWLDAAQVLVGHYKKQGKIVILVANAAWAAWARDLAIFEEVLPVNVRQFQHDPIYRYRVGRQIQRLGCSIAIEPTYSRSWLLGDSAIRISGARERIGSAGDASNLSRRKRIADLWYTRLVPADPAPCMELERNAEFIRNFCQPAFLAALPQLPCAAAPQDDIFLAATAGQPYYVLFPGASWEGRRWPVAGFLEVGEKLHRRTGWLGVVCGGASDLDTVNDLCGRSTVPLLNWAGRTDLAQLASILSAARLLITNETSAVHMGAACGTPTVCLLGGGHYGRFMPYQIHRETARPVPSAVIHAMPCFGCNWQCIYQRPAGEPVPCIQQIDTEEVWRAILQTLGDPD